MSAIVTVGMLELDRKLSKVLDSARRVPVSVSRYGSPWVWVVSHEAWMGQVQLTRFVPPRHPWWACANTWTTCCAAMPPCCWSRRAVAAGAARTDAYRCCAAPSSCCWFAGLTQGLGADEEADLTGSWT